MPKTETLLAIALCAALNLSLGSVVYLLKLPIYLDMVGTLLCALLFWDRPSKAFFASAGAGAVSFVLGGLLVNPYLPAFTGTVICVAALTAFVTCRSAPAFRGKVVGDVGLAVRIIGYGVLTGLAAAIVSAPVVVFLFGGVTGSGSALIVAFFLKTGRQLLQAALMSGFTAEPVDKTLQLALAVMLFRATPESFVRLIHGTAERPEVSNPTPEGERGATPRARNDS